MENRNKKLELNKEKSFLIFALSFRWFLRKLKKWLEELIMHSQLMAQGLHAWVKTQNTPAPCVCHVTTMNAHFVNLKNVHLYILLIAHMSAVN